MTVPEVRNRATIAGAIEIGRHPGVVQVTFRAPAERLEARGLLGYAREQYRGALVSAADAFRPRAWRRRDRFRAPRPEDARRASDSPAEGRTIS